MKDMKIKLHDANREKVIALLEHAGHRRAASGMEFYDRAAYIYTYADDEVITHGGTKEIFDNHPNEEHWLADGALVPFSYWTQPYTGVSFTIHGPESEQFKKAQKEFYDKVTGYTETSYEPLPFHLKPRSEFLHERNVDILNVMLEYVTEGKRIPDDMISELGKNNEEIYGNDF